MESDDHTCPTCHQNDVSPDALIANKFLRQVAMFVSFFMNSFFNFVLIVLEYIFCVFVFGVRRLLITSKMKLVIQKD